MKKQEVELSGKGGAVRGSCETYSLIVEPTWHANAQKGVTCMGRKAVLDLKLQISGAEDPSGARSRLDGMLDSTVTVKAKGLRFTGHVTRMHWLQRMDANGDPGAGTIEILLEEARKP